MKITKIAGVFKDKNRIFTENYSKGSQVYNERLVKIKGIEYRSWNPYRSKLAAAIHNDFEFDIKKDMKILYLGAATGTTVSHFSDIVKDGIVYAVELSPIAVNDLIKICEKRANIIPILADANHPDRYSSIVTLVDIVYQDISQRNQTEIFIENINKYLKNNGIGILMVKARSIDVSLKPTKAYEMVCSQLEKNDFKILKKLELSPYEKDHMAILLSK